MTAITPFDIIVSHDDVADLQQRIRNTRWPDAETSDDWSQGVPLAYVQELVQYLSLIHI